MLWLALHFPELPLEIFSRGAALFEPFAVVEKQGNRTSVIACNELAGVSGVRPGMPVSAAQALVTGLAVRARDGAAEEESLAGLAAWAGRFTPAVSFQPPDGLLLEIGSCLRLHRGLDNLLGQVRSGLDEMGYTVTHACAPTPHGAWLLALAGSGAATVEPQQFRQALVRLPVRLLAQPPEIIDGLEMVGTYTLGDCLRLPRPGMARRFGQALLDELDRAFGRQPEARKYFEPPPSFHRSLPLPAPVHEAEALIFAARRLLPELEGYLSLRQAGVQELELICRHEHVPDTKVKLGFVQPTRAAERMQLLLRETLGRTALPEPVDCIVLSAQRILSLEQSNADLFQEGEETGDSNLLLERLRIRLGKEVVYGLALTADHRPELAWQPCEAGNDAALSANRQRPLWLLPEPVPWRDGRQVVTGNAERIESGWWDGREVARDYYVAEDRNGARLWVYCDRVSGEWFVHGLFA
ncbi:MAG TPA: DNA polymerase Y family protein [Gallionella sp.]|nr:DNA polymerase Y family protein [Gallionella sp.]